VHSPELGDGIVTVLVEDLLVQLVGVIEANGGVNRGVAREVEIAKRRRRLFEDLE
jgi:hypothetical protein